MPKRADVPKTPEKSAGSVQKLKSGVEVWYPKSLYNNGAPATQDANEAGGSSNAAKLSKFAARKLKKKAAVSDDEEDQGTGQNISTNKAGPSALPLPASQRTHSLPSKPKTTESLPALGAREVVKLKSGVTVWYPEALYGKNASLGSVEPSVPRLENDIPPEMRRRGWIKSLSKKTNQPYYFNVKSGESSYDRPSEFADYALSDVESQIPASPGAESPTPAGTSTRKKFTKRKRTASLGDTRRVGQSHGTVALNKGKPISKKVAPKRAEVESRLSEDDEDVEMLELPPASPSVNCISEDDNSMDVDTFVDTVNTLRQDANYSTSQLPEFNLPPPPPPMQQKNTYCLVFDTNIFLSPEGGNFLMRLVQGDAKMLPTIQIRIPYIVLLELDHLKERKGQPVAQAAIQAIRFLNDRVTEARDPRFVGQTYTEHKRGITEDKPTRNDDHILIYHRQLLHAGLGPVICVTNDRNLQTRATFDQLLVISGVKLQEEVRNCLQQFPSIFDGSSSSATATFTYTSVVDKPQPLVTETTQRSPGQEVLQQLFACLEIILRKLLSDVLENRMKQVYGNDNLWLNIVKSPPPWRSLQLVVDLILKHWIAVFSDIFNYQDQELFKTLVTAVPVSGAILRMSEVDKLAETSIKLFSVLEKLGLNATAPYRVILIEARRIVERWRAMVAGITRGQQGTQVLQNECLEFLKSNGG